jgi:hypothetical protein
MGSPPWELPRAFPSEWHKASQPFRCGSCPAPPDDTPTGRDCLAATPLDSSAGSRRELLGFYLGPAPPLRLFNHPADLGRAPVTTPAAIVVPALFMLVADKLTWLSGINPRALVVWPGFRHGIVSAADDVGDDFRGQNVQAPPYPSTLAVHRLASPIGSARPSRLRLLVRLPVRAFAPFIVELFAASDLRSTPGLIITRFPASWRWKLPTPAHVERASCEATNPVGGLAGAKAIGFQPSASPTSSMKALVRTPTKVCPHRPRFRKRHIGIG